MKRKEIHSKSFIALMDIVANLIVEQATREFSGSKWGEEALEKLQKIRIGLYEK